jgi:hypothetical protein
VHPAVLAMDEMPHDKVPAQMHVPRGMVAAMPPPVAQLQAAASVGSGLRSIPQPPQVPSVSSGSGARPMPPPIPGSAAPAMSTLDAAMSALDRLDDDPTTIMTREELAMRENMGSRRPAPQQPQPPQVPAGFRPQGQPPVLGQGYQGPLAHDATIPTQSLAAPQGFAPPRGPAGQAMPAGPMGGPRPPQAARPAPGQGPGRLLQGRQGSMWMMAALGAGALLLVLVILLAFGVI